MSEVKTIAISFCEGRVIRDFFENNLVDILQNNGFRVIFFTPAERVPYFRSKWESKGVKLYPLLPYSPSRKEQRIEKIRKVIAKRSKKLHNRLLKYYHSFFDIDNKIKETLNKENCKLVFITNPKLRNETLLWSTAKNLGIPVIGAIRSWDNLHQGLKIFPDELLVWNEVNKNEAINMVPFSKSNTHVIGSCQFDQYFNEEYYLSRESFFESLKLDPNRPLITLATIGIIWPGWDENYIVDQLIELIKNNEIEGKPQLMIRLHPVSKYEHFIKYLDCNFVRISNITENIPTLGWSMTKEDVRFIGNLLRHSDLVISPGSTITIETAIFNTPTLFPIYHTYQPEYAKLCYNIVLARHHKRLRELKLVNFIEEPSDLLPAIQRSLVEPSWFEKERTRLKEDYICFFDGKSTERLADFLMKNTCKN